MKQIEIKYEYEAMHMGVPVIIENPAAECLSIDVKYRGTGWILDVATWFYFMFCDGPFRFDHVKKLSRPIIRKVKVSDEAD